MKLSEIQIRDPFILPVVTAQTYYLFGTTDKDCWVGPFEGFDCYSSADLENWDGPFPAFRRPADFWANANNWAPEVFAYNGKYFMLATFTPTKGFRGTQVLIADKPEGPYTAWSDGPVTPHDWACLDGTLFIDKADAPWMVFCHEWHQIGDGTVCAVRLSPDLKEAQGEPVVLFSASQAPWVNRSSEKNSNKPQHYVTDGPFFHCTPDGTLLMLWSSFGSKGYAMAIARSESGDVLGPWTQDAKPLWAEDGGHGMIFRAFDDRLFLVLHGPNNTPDERAMLHELIETEDSIQLA